MITNKEGKEFLNIDQDNYRLAHYIDRASDAGEFVVILARGTPITDFIIEDWDIRGILIIQGSAAAYPIDRALEEGR